MTPTPYNLYNFETNFRLHLKKRGFAEISIRNYLVDLRHFFRWLKIYGGSLSSAEEYKNFLLNTRLPPYILNRRLATLKKFSDFCLSQKLSRETRAQKGNRKAGEEILEKFTNFLKKEGRKPATIKNYSADVRQVLKMAINQSFNKSVFIQYLEKLKKADKSSPLTVKRKLASLKKFCQFLDSQGLLENNPRGLPAWLPSKKGLVLFFLFLLLAIPSLTLTFTDSWHLLIPLLSKLPQLPQLSLFPKKAEVSLPSQEIENLSFETPRNQTLGESLLASLTPSFITPVIDSQGRLVFAGNFSLEGQQLTLKTSDSSGGDITINPDSAGALNLFFEGQSPGEGKGGFINAQAANISEAALFAGEVGSDNQNFDFLRFRSGVELTDRFRVDARGDIYSGGKIETAGKKLILGTENQEVLTLEPNSIILRGLTYDGGLGIYGISGAPLPLTFDFTKNLNFEFDFQLGTKGIEIKFNQDQIGNYYSASWGTDGKVLLQKCLSGICSNLASQTIDFPPNSWHHGRIAFVFGQITFEIDFEKAKLVAPAAVDLPATANGQIQFSPEIKALENLRIFPGEDMILTSGNAKIGDNLVVGSNLNIKGNLYAENGFFMSGTAGGNSWISGGNIGIGTTSPGTKLAVAGLTGTSSYDLVRVDTATGNFYYDSSSERYKSDIQPLNDDFNKILDVEPKSFTDKTSGQGEIGFIAEALDALGLQNLVIYKDGRPDAVKYEKVPLYLLEVVKEQQKKIEELLPEKPVISPVIETETIKPSGFGDLIIDLNRGNPDSSDLPAGKAGVEGFGKLIIKGIDNQEVASIDASGNATFSGQVTVNELEGERVTSDELVTNEMTAQIATVAGTLYAQKIESEEINGLTGKFGEILSRIEKLEETQTETLPLDQTETGLLTLADTQTAMPSSIVEASAEATPTASFSALLAEVDNFIKELLTTPLANVSADRNLAENLEANSEQLTIKNKFTVLGSASLADTTIAGNLLVGGGLSLTSNSLASVGTLYLSAAEGIHLSGDVTIENDLAVKGSLLAGILKPPENQDLTIDLRSQESEFGKLLVKGVNGEIVASIDAHGNSQFNGKLTAGTGNFQKIVIASANPAPRTSEEVKSNATAGTAILPSFQTELLITNDSITDNSLIYLTPLSPTENKVLFVRTKKGPILCPPTPTPPEEFSPEQEEVECQEKPGWFTVALDSPISQDIQFNWWVIN